MLINIHNQNLLTIHLPLCFSPAVDQSALMVEVCGSDFSFHNSNPWDSASVSAQQIPAKHITANIEITVTLLYSNTQIHINSTCFCWKSESFFFFFLHCKTMSLKVAKFIKVYKFTKHINTQCHNKLTELKLNDLHVVSWFNVCKYVYEK